MGKPVDATQELIAIGTANIANSMVQGFPGTGSLSRSAVNNASGVRTPFGNVYTAALIILSLLFFTPYFSYIPKACLAAIIIAAVIFMVEVKVIAPMWRTKSKFHLLIFKSLLTQLTVLISNNNNNNIYLYQVSLLSFVESDLIPGLGTFIACLALPLEIGILTGIGINVVFILYHAARPKISIETLRVSLMEVSKRVHLIKIYLFVLITESWWNGISHHHIGSLSDFPLSGLCAQTSDEAFNEAIPASGHRLLTHLRNGLHGCNRCGDDNERFRETGSTTLLLQFETKCVCCV